MIALSESPILAFQLANLNDYGNHRVTATYPPGADTVLSVQPDGRYETRPHGTAGPYELAQQSGDRLVYGPYTGGVVYVVPIVLLP